MGGGVCSLGETRQRCGRLAGHQGGLWCEWQGAESCGRSERQGTGPGGLFVKRGGCGVSGRGVGAVADRRDKAEVREAWWSSGGGGCEWPGPDSCTR